MAHLILIVIAMVLFLAAAVGGWAGRPYVSVGWLGAFFIALDMLLRVSG